MNLRAESNGTSATRGSAARVSAMSPDDIALRLGECEHKLQQLLGHRGIHQVDIGAPPRQGTKARREFEMRQLLANWAGVDLTRINGLGIGVVMTLLSEIGPDLSRFATVKQFCSWLALCPGTKISGGKVLSAAQKARSAWNGYGTMTVTIRGWRTQVWRSMPTALASTTTKASSHPIGPLAIPAMATPPAICRACWSA